MNDATVQQLAAAIQALAAAAAAAPPPPVAPAAPNFILLYEGDALDLSSRTRTSLFQKGSEPLTTKFTGKVKDLHLFLTNLKDHAETCRWNSPTHGILSLTRGAPPVTYNLLKDYGKVTNDQVKAACMTCMTGPDIRAKQNSQMMYECLSNSIIDEAKAVMASSDLDFYEDGPVLFFHIMNQLFTATFLNAQAT